MTDNRSALATGIFIAAILWVPIVFALLDPLLRRALFALTGIRIERRRAGAVTIRFESVTAGRGEWLAALWEVLLYGVLLLPVVIALVVWGFLWTAAHRGA